MNKAEELEMRLTTHESITSDLTAQTSVTDLVVRALIATHPHPEAVKAALQIMLSASESELPDSAFSFGLPVEASRQMQKKFAHAAEKWMRAFPKAPSSPDTSS